VLVGEVDFTEAHEFLQNHLQKERISIAEVLELAQQKSIKSIKTALLAGTVSVKKLEPAVLYRFPAGTIHRMQGFDVGKSYPLRFCIEQYLKPSE
jgi:hypothetical protein